MCLLVGILDALPERLWVTQRREDMEPETCVVPQVTDRRPDELLARLAAQLDERFAT